MFVLVILEKVLGSLATTDAVAAVAAVQSGDLAALAAAGATPSPGPLTVSVTTCPECGESGRVDLKLQAITQKSFAELMVEYAAAVMLNGTGAPPRARAFTTYDFPSAIGAVRRVPAGTYPYPVTASGSTASASFAQGGTWSGPIGNGGLRIHEFVSNGTGAGAEIIVHVEPPARVVREIWERVFR